MLAHQLQIYRETYRLAEMLLGYNSNISRTVRYGIYQECIDGVCKALDMIYRANSDIEVRYDALTEYLVLMGGVRTRLRLLGDSGYLPVKKHLAFMTQMDKCQKQGNGWRASCARSESR